VACVTHWRPQGGGSGLGRGSSTARAARRPRSSPELGAWAPRARQGLRDLAQRDQGARAVLTEARIEQCRRAGAPALMEGGGVRVGARERALQGSEQRETARGRSGHRGGAGALLGRGSGVAGRRGRGGAEARRGGSERRGG